MAFRLMGQAMKTTDDVQLAPQWRKYAASLNEDLIGVRKTIEESAKKQTKFGQKPLSLTMIYRRLFRFIPMLH